MSISFFLHTYSKIAWNQTVMTTLDLLPDLIKGATDRPTCMEIDSELVVRGSTRLAKADVLLK